jgi:hypothetical protein
MGISATLLGDEAAKVTEKVNDVEAGTKSGGTAPAKVGTMVHDGGYLETGMKSRAALLLPTSSITRLGSNTRFNYSADSNTIDLQEGAILFCKPPDAAKLNIMTAGISAGITGTTGFVSVTGGSRKTYTLGLIEGAAIVHADGQPFPIGSGEIVQFTPGQKPFQFAYDIPRFVKSSPLLHRFTGTLPNQSKIDHALAEYADDVRRGFIVPPSKSIDYSGEIPVLSNVAYSSAQNANQPKGSPPPPPSSTYRPGGQGGSSFH